MWGSTPEHEPVTASAGIGFGPSYFAARSRIESSSFFDVGP